MRVERWSFMSKIIEHWKIVLGVIVFLGVVSLGAKYNIPVFVEIQTLINNVIGTVLGLFIAARILKKAKLF